jgi:exonuclease III
MKSSFDFKQTGNNIIYADVLVQEDTIRIYNIHLQSLKINPNKENFGEKDAMSLRNRLSDVFQKQQKQVELLLNNQQTIKHKIIVAGDFNNTAFSWPYRKILKGKKDAYVVAGKGFDKTYDFAFPMRIDFILVDKDITINHFKAYRDKYSDHFPILARLDLKPL